MSKNIRGYFTISSSKTSSIAAASSKDISNSDSEDSDIEPVAKKPCHSLFKIYPTSTSSKKCHYLKDGRQILSGWSMMKTFKVLSVYIVKSGQRQTTKLEEHGLLNRIANNWKKAVAKMQEHAESEGHIYACQVETNIATALLRGSIAQQLQQVQESERLKTGQQSNLYYIVYTSLLINTLPILLILVNLF